MKEDLISALINLGYKKKIAERAVVKAMHDNGESTDFDTLFKAALDYLANPNGSKKSLKDVVQAKNETTGTGSQSSAGPSAPVAATQVPGMNLDTELLDHISHVLNKQLIVFEDILDIISGKNQTEHEIMEENFWDKSLDFQERLLIMMGNGPVGHQPPKKEEEKQLVKPRTGILGAIGNALFGKNHEGGIFQGLKKAFGKIFAEGEIAQGLKGFGKGALVTYIAVGILNGIRGFVEEYMASGDFIKSLRESFLKIVDTFTLGLISEERLSKIYSMLDEAWTNIYDGIRMFINDPKYFIGKFVGWIADLVMKVPDVLQEFQQLIMQKTVELITRAPELAANLAKFMWELASDLIDGLKTVVKGAVGLITTAPGKIYDWVKGVVHVPTEAEHIATSGGLNKQIAAEKGIMAQQHAEAEQRYAGRPSTASEILQTISGATAPGLLTQSIASTAPTVGDRIDSSSKEIASYGAKTVAARAPIVVAPQTQIQNNSQNSVIAVKPFVRNQENTFNRFITSRMDGMNSVFEY